MNDKPIPFSMQRARPIKGPGVADEPRMVAEPPKRQLKRQVTDRDGATEGGEVIDAHPPIVTDEGPTQTEAQPSIPIGDVLILARLPKTMELINIFSALNPDEAKFALHLLYKMHPELFK